MLPRVGDFLSQIWKKIDFSNIFWIKFHFLDNKNWLKVNVKWYFTLKYPKSNIYGALHRQGTGIPSAGQMVFYPEIS